MWATSKDPAVTEVFPGCYLIPVLETHRRERIGLMNGVWRDVILMERRSSRV